MSDNKGLNDFLRELADGDAVTNLVTALANDAGFDFTAEDLAEAAAGFDIEAEAPRPRPTPIDPPRMTTMSSEPEKRF
jgi:hypothetical protein